MNKLKTELLTIETGTEIFGMSDRPAFQPSPNAEFYPPSIVPNQNELQILDNHPMLIFKNFRIEGEMEKTPLYWNIVGLQNLPPPKEQIKFEKPNLYWNRSHSVFEKSDIFKFVLPLEKIELIKSSMDDLMIKLEEKFTIYEGLKLKNYINRLTKTNFSIIDDVDNFIENLTSFLNQKELEFDGQISLFVDHEIKDYEDISIAVKIQKTPSECVTLLHDFIKMIVSVDDKILDHIQIQFLPIKI